MWGKWRQQNGASEVGAIRYSLGIAIAVLKSSAHKNLKKMHGLAICKLLE